MHNSIMRRNNDSNGSDGTDDLSDFFSKEKLGARSAALPINDVEDDCDMAHSDGSRDRK